MPAKGTRTRKRSEHYVNNKEFLYAIVQYKADVKEAEEKGDPKPRITNYLGECFVKIATHLSYKPNFVNYMFREDMISDGIENCVQYIHNFNPEKSTNPLLTSLKSYTMLSSDVYRKRKNKWRSVKRSLRSRGMMRLCTLMMLAVILAITIQ